MSVKKASVNGTTETIELKLIRENIETYVESRDFKNKPQPNIVAMVTEDTCVEIDTETMRKIGVNYPKLQDEIENIYSVKKCCNKEQIVIEGIRYEVSEKTGTTSTASATIHIASDTPPVLKGEVLSSKTTSNKNKKPKYKKNNDYVSIPTSMVTTELTRKHTPDVIDRARKNVSKRKETDAGIINLLAHIPTIDELSTLTDEEMLKQFGNMNLGLSREQFQIYCALFDLFLVNGKRASYKLPVDIATRDLHYEILGHNKKTKFRQSNYEYYKNAALTISSKRIEYTTSKAKQKYLSKGKYKNINVNSALMQIDIIEGGEGEYKEQVLRVIPTSYMQHEINIMKQLSNCFPREFLNLNEHDNFVYFGFYINKMHKINSCHKEPEERTVRGKIIKRMATVHHATYAWEVSLKKLIEEALPDGEKIVEEFARTERKREYLDRKILPYLTKALDVYKGKGYILKYNQKEIKSINARTVFDNDDFKISLIFNYQKEKYKSEKP